MIDCETIARAICETGKCCVCDSSCIDYRAAERVLKVIEAENNNIVNSFATNLKNYYSSPMYQEPGAHTMIIKLFSNIDDVVRSMTR